MTSSAALSTKHNLKQCHVINLNLTNATTLLSKKLHLSAQPGDHRNNNNNNNANDSEISDTDEICNASRAFKQRSKSTKFKSKSAHFETNAKQETLALAQQSLPTQGSVDSIDNAGNNNKSLMNFQSTLRTYCLDGDFVSRHKKQRLKSFNAKIRRSIKTQIKKRHQMAAESQKSAINSSEAHTSNSNEVMTTPPETADKPRAKTSLSSQSPKLSEVQKPVETTTAPKSNKSSKPDSHQTPSAFSQQQVAKLKEAYKPVLSHHFPHESSSTSSQRQQKQQPVVLSIEHQLEHIEAKHSIDSSKKSPYMETFKRQQILNTALPSQHQQQTADNTNDLGNSKNTNNKHSVPSLFKHNNNQHQHVASSPPNKSPVVCTNDKLVSNKSANEEEAVYVNHLDATSLKLMAVEQRTIELSGKASSIGYKAKTEPQREAINPLSHNYNQNQEQQQQLLDVNKTMNISTKQSSSNNHRATTAKAATAEFSVENSNISNNIQLKKPTLKISNFAGLKLSGTGTTSDEPADKLKQLTSDYEIIETLLIDDLTPDQKFLETSNLKQSIKDLKVDFEKKLEAKKFLIQNLNLTGSGLTIVKKASSTSANAVNTTEISQPSQRSVGKQSDAEIGNHNINERVMQNKQQTKFASISNAGQRNHSGPAVATTGASSVDNNVGNKQGMSNVRNRKLIFKRNFSDESESDNKIGDNTGIRNIEPFNENYRNKPGTGLNTSSTTTGDGITNEHGVEGTNVGENKAPGDFNNDSIHRVYEKTKVLIRNFYKNFDLMNENQQKLEQQIQMEQHMASMEPKMNSIALQHGRSGGNVNSTPNSINSIMTNTPYTPHWFNIATMGSTYTANSKSAKYANRFDPHQKNRTGSEPQPADSTANSSMIKTDNSTNANATGASSTGNYAKEASRSPVSQSVYLYSSMNKVSKNSNVQETKEGKVILNNFRGYKVKTMRDGTIEDTAEQEIYSSTNEAVPQSSSSGHKSLLNREKQKLISLNEARNQSDNNSTESQQDYEYIKFPDLNKKNTHNSSHSPSDDSPSSTKNVIVPLTNNNNQQHQSRQQQYMSKPFNASQSTTINNTNTNPSQQTLAGQNYVLAQMTKYQRNNSVNLLNLSTQKMFANQATCHNNNFMSSGVIRPKNSLLKQKDFFGNDSEGSKSTFANQILCRGNTLITRELSQHVLSQQQKIRTFDTQTMQQSQHQQQQNQGPQINASKVKLSQIQSKPKSSSSLLSVNTRASIDNSSQHNHNDNSSIDNSHTNTNTTGVNSATSRFTAHSKLQEQNRAKAELHSILKTSESERQKSENQDASVVVSETTTSNSAAATTAAAAKSAADLRLRNQLEEAPLSKPQGLYTYAVTSSCQLRESFYNNRSLINTSSNCTNQLIYNRSDSFYASNQKDLDQNSDAESQKEQKTQQATANSGNEVASATTPADGHSPVELMGQVNNTAGLIEPMEPIKNTKKNRRIFKDLDFIYNEQQVFKLSRQIWFQIRTNRFRNNQNRLNENHLNQYLDQLNNSSMLINKLYNYDVYKFYERAKISLLIKCLTPLKSNFNKSNGSEGSTNHIMKNINNIQSLSERNRDGIGGQQQQQTTSQMEFNKNHYMFDKDLIMYSKGDAANASQTSIGENAIEEEIEDEIDDDEQEEDLINGINRELFYSEMDREGKDSFDGDDSGADDKNSNSSAGVDYTTNKEPADVPA